MLLSPPSRWPKSGDYECFYFIADYHSLTSVHKGSDLRQYILEIAAAWLSLGLDPSKVTLYTNKVIFQKFSSFIGFSIAFTAKGLMNRAHAYKAMVQDNEAHQRDSDQGVNMGLYSYPVLMAADILFLKADHVPVGADQVQHIEIARDIAMAFNHHYGEILKLPTAKVQQATGAIPGLDGRKMSKSYQNHIPLFLPQKQLQKMINRIVTDSTPPEEPKDPDASLLFTLSTYFMSEQELKDLREWYLRGISWGEAKAELFKVINRDLEQPRAQYVELMENPKKIHDILEEGASRVRPRAQELLASIKQAIGVR
jgi:tryptophanyl-tRNA synthetase